LIGSSKIFKRNHYLICFYQYLKTDLLFWGRFLFGMKIEALRGVASLNAAKYSYLTSQLFRFGRLRINNLRIKNQIQNKKRQPISGLSFISKMIYKKFIFL